MIDTIDSFIDELIKVDSKKSGVNVFQHFKLYTVTKPTDTKNTHDLYFQSITNVRINVSHAVDKVAKTVSFWYTDNKKVYDTFASVLNNDEVPTKVNDGLRKFRVTVSIDRAKVIFKKLLDENIFTKLTS